MIIDVFIYSKLPYNTGNVFLKWGMLGESTLDKLHLFTQCATDHMSELDVEEFQYTPPDKLY
jgi:hypothetical protein